MRELPIAAQYVGKSVPAAKEERVFVRLKLLAGCARGRLVGTCLPDSPLIL
jgi:pyrimidine operon attenuation protein/uracil phosphoribosyltransferase